MTTTAHPESVARPADAPAEAARFGPVHLDVIDPDSEHRDDGVLGHDPIGDALLLTAFHAPDATDSQPADDHTHSHRRWESLNHRACSTTEGIL
jgi:hypothetical protein